MTTESTDPPAVFLVLFLVMGIGIIGYAGYMYLSNPDRAVLWVLVGGCGAVFTVLAIKATVTALRSSDTYETVSREDI